MLKTYAKGAAAERELLHYLNSKGFAVMRAPSSGGTISPADIIALKSGLVLAIECKAHAVKPRPSKDQLNRISEWCKKAGAIGLLAWRTYNKWLFLRLDNALNNQYEDENWIELDRIIAIFG